MNETTTQTGRILLPDDRYLNLDRTLVMGILNVTPDSFSDGGMFFEPDQAVQYALEMIAQGADIIDIGGESSRPGSEPVEMEEELKRVLPVIRAVRESTRIPISIDTTKGEVAREALRAGANIINDISALRSDPEMAEVAATYKAPVVLMHMLGTPRTMQLEPRYQDCIKEIRQFFSERIHHCHNYGIDKAQIIIDPGIGFGKRLEDNLEIIRRLEDFAMFDCPLMLGTSRKSFISMITKDKQNPENRIGGSLASAVLAILKGINILRVHDVAATVEAIKVVRAIEGTG
ncbi:MAG: dihydropteroate synthase [Candidatus Zixiibacteriota bacterium]|nr:MAG: dihydropteroate synthase [candidate division Zixibacteria bacterium]